MSSDKNNNLATSTSSNASNSSNILDLSDDLINSQFPNDSSESKFLRDLITRVSVKKDNDKGVVINQPPDKLKTTEDGKIITKDGKMIDPNRMDKDVLEYLMKINKDVMFYWTKMYVYSAFWSNISTPLNLSLMIITAVTTGQSATQDLLSKDVSTILGLVALIISVINTFFRPNQQMTENQNILKKWTEIGAKFDSIFYEHTETIEAKVERLQMLKALLEEVNKLIRENSNNYVIDLLFMIIRYTCLQKICCIPRNKKKMVWNHDILEYTEKYYEHVEMKYQKQEEKRINEEYVNSGIDYYFSFDEYQKRKERKSISWWARMRNFFCLTKSLEQWQQELENEKIKLKEDITHLNLQKCEIEKQRERINKECNEKHKELAKYIQDNLKKNEDLRQNIEENIYRRRSDLSKIKKELTQLENNKMKLQNEILLMNEQKYHLKKRDNSLTTEINHKIAEYCEKDEKLTKSKLQSSSSLQELQDDFENNLMKMNNHDAIKINIETSSLKEEQLDKKLNKNNETNQLNQANQLNNVNQVLSNNKNVVNDKKILSNNLQVKHTNKSASMLNLTKNSQYDLTSSYEV